MSFNIASSFGASMPVVGVVPGFQNVKSDVATQLLGSTPSRNQETRLRLAGDALAAKLKLAELRDTLDAQMEQFDATRRQSVASNLAAIGGNLARAGGASFGGSSAVADVNPLETMEVVQGMLDRQKARHASNSRRVNQGVVDAVSALGPV